MGLKADRRAFELAKLGYYDSSNFRYEIEHRRRGKYAEFRVSRKIPLKITPILEASDLMRENEARLEFFNSYGN